VAKENVAYLGCTGEAYTTPPARPGTTEARTAACYQSLRQRNKQRCYADGHQRPGTADDHDGTGESFGDGWTDGDLLGHRHGLQPTGICVAEERRTIAGAAAASYTTPATILSDNGSTSGASFPTAREPTRRRRNADGVQHAAAAVNILANPGFETGPHLVVLHDGAGTLASVTSGFESSRAGRVSITTPGTNVQLYKNNLVLEPNTDYIISFNAYSTTGRDFAVSLLQQVTPFASYGLNTWCSTSARRGILQPSVPHERIRGHGQQCPSPFLLAPYDAAGERLLPRRGADSEVVQAVPPSIVTIRRT